MKKPTSIDLVADRLSPRQKEWLWFVALWCAGLAVALTLGGVIKFLMSLI